MRTDKGNTHLTFHFIHHKISFNKSVPNFSSFGVYYPKTNKTPFTKNEKIKQDFPNTLLPRGVLLVLSNSLWGLYFLSILLRFLFTLLSYSICAFYYVFVVFTTLTFPVL